MKRKTGLACGNVTIVLGVVLLVAGVVIPLVVIPGKIEEGVTAKVVISAGAEGYSEWVTNDYEDATAKYNTYYFFNITNKNEYLQGAKPVLQEVGPYTFREKYRYDDVTFGNNEETVSYATVTTQVFETELSPSRSLNDVITTIGLPYLKVVHKADKHNFTGEQYVLLKGAETAFEKIKRGFTDSTVDYFEDGELARTMPDSIWRKAIPSIIDSGVRKMFDATLDLTYINTFDEFINRWSGGCTTAGVLENVCGIDKGIAAGSEAKLAAYEPGFCSCSSAKGGSCPSDCSGKNLALAVAKKLFDRRDPYSFMAGVNSNTDVNNGTCIFDKTPCQKNPKVFPDFAEKELGSYLWLDTNDTYREILKSHFGLSETDYSKVRAWLVKLPFNTLIQGDLRDTFNGFAGETTNGIPSASTGKTLYTDASILHWGNGKVAARGDKLRSVKDTDVAVADYSFLADNAQYGTNDVSYIYGEDAKAIPEIAVWAYRYKNKREIKLTYTESKALLDFLQKWGEPDEVNESTVWSLFDAAGVPYAIAPTASVANIPTSKLTAADIKEYVMYVAMTFVKDAFQEDYIDPGYGLVVSKSVQDLILGYEDALLNKVLDDEEYEGDPRKTVSLSTSDPGLNEPALCRTSSDRALIEDEGREFDSCYQDPSTKLYMRKKSTFYTGKDNVNKAAQLVDTFGYESLPMWNKELQLRDAANVFGAEVSPMVGFSTGSQFPPLNKLPSKLALYVDALNQPVSLTFDKDDTVKGIKLKNYVLDASAFALNSWKNEYGMIARDGFLNLTLAKDAPVFVSKPHFKDVSPNADLLSAVIGLAPSEIHDTTIAVEPITGKTMKLDLKIMISAQAPPPAANSTQFFYPNVSRAIVPIYTKQVTAEINDVSATEFKDKIYGAQDLADLMLIAGVAAGVILIVAGAILTVVYYRRSDAAVGYEEHDSEVGVLGLLSHHDQSAPHRFKNPMV